jgi:hypothetical protein
MSAELSHTARCFQYGDCEIAPGLPDTEDILVRSVSGRLSRTASCVPRFSGPIPRECTVLSGFSLIVDGRSIYCNGFSITIDGRNFDSTTITVDTSFTLWKRLNPDLLVPFVTNNICELRNLYATWSKEKGYHIAYNGN